MQLKEFSLRVMTTKCKTIMYFQATNATNLTKDIANHNLIYKIPTRTKFTFYSLFHLQLKNQNLPRETSEQTTVSFLFFQVDPESQTMQKHILSAQPLKKSIPEIEYTSTFVIYFAAY